MSRMNEKQLREYLGKLYQNKDRLATDPEFLKEFLRDHLNSIPYRKLYKFRACNNNNFGVLEDNSIWMAPASSFPDSLDSIIKMDLRENAYDIKNWFQNTFKPTAFKVFLKQLEETLGAAPAISYEDVMKYEQECVESQGTIDAEKEKAYLKSHATDDELSRFDKAYDEMQILKKQIGSNRPNIIASFEQAIENVRKNTRNNSLVYCLSERKDNPSLWENYAKNYTGYCIEYSFSDFSHTPVEAYKNLLYLVPMVYKQKPNINFVRLLDASLRAQWLGDNSGFFDQDLAVDLNMQLYYKSNTYSYEKEWRFVIEAKTENKQYFPFVSALYAGKDIKPQNCKRLNSIAKKLGVPLYQQKVNYETTGFQYELIRC